MAEDKELPANGFALLGLLSLGGKLTGYELKQRADRTLRFFWLSPAMSQVYTELDRLQARGFVAATESAGPGRRTRRFAITEAGSTALREWMHTSAPEFPVLKHSVALRLFLGHLTEPERTGAMLAEYAEKLRARIDELTEIRERLAANPPTPFPALVAEWGQRYYAAEIDVVLDLARRLDPAEDSPPGA